ncbi:MAG: TraB/GumN family protein [Ginsengibacter sp.]
MKRFSLLLLFFCFSHALFAQTKNANGETSNTLLWKITGKGIKESYLFGTFHLMCKDDIHFSSNMLRSLKKSDELCLEIKMDAGDLFAKSIEFISMKNNATLKDVLSDSDYKKLSQYFSDSLHTPIFLLQKMKPFFLMAMLYPKMLPCNNATGVEEELMASAKQYKKPVIGLETLEYQASIFDSIPYKLQASELVQTIDSLSSSKKEFQQMVEYYKAQRLDKLSEKSLKSENITSKYNDILLKNRNDNWVKKLPALLKRKSLFIAIGAGHLPGQYGLIKLFRQSGYTVTPINN